MVSLRIWHLGLGAESVIRVGGKLPIENRPEAVSIMFYRDLNKGEGGCKLLSTRYQALQQYPELLRSETSRDPPYNPMVEV